MIEIDGSYGEGGGQVLRTALALSAILRVPCKIKNIRAKRKKPGLMPQHLTGVRAAAQIGNAETEGDLLGSTELLFLPKAKNLEAKNKNYNFVFDVAGERGSAGAVTLVIQTILPIMLFSSYPFRATVRGGTHVPFSPIYEYLERVLLPFLHDLGFKVKSEISSFGFYPLGGGEVVIETQPGEIGRDSLTTPLELIHPGRLKTLKIVSGVSQLPISIAERQANRLKQRIEKESNLLIDRCETPVVNGRCPGTYIFLEAEYEKVKVGFSNLGEKGKPAERVADEVYEKFQKHHSTKKSLDPNLADQVLVYLALSQRPFKFTTSQVTNHLKTNIWTITQFLPSYRIELIEWENGTGEVRGAQNENRT